MSSDGEHPSAGSDDGTRVEPRRWRVPARRGEGIARPGGRPSRRRLRRLSLRAASGLPLILALFLVGCSPPEDSSPESASREPASRPLRVVATTGLVAELVREVGGDRVQVTALMGPGIDPHQYRAREGDIRRIAEADIVFYHGLHLEARLAEVLERLAGRQRTAAVTASIDRNRLLMSPDGHGPPDPHIWFDVGLWMEALREVERVLCELDSAHAATYRENSRQELEVFAELDRYVRARAASLAPARRVLVTAHDAFRYFGRAYDFDVRGLQGISTVAEAGTADLKELADYIAARRIAAIFVESSVSSRSVQALQAAVRARGFEVALGGSLYSDALGSPGTPAAVYPGMVRHNIDTIVDALARE